MKNAPIPALSESRRNAPHAAASLLLTAILLAAAGCREGTRGAPPASIPASPSTASAASSATPAAERETEELVVEGMHCAACPLTVKTAARAVPGVVAARVSMEQGRAWVRYLRGETASGAIAEAITRAGYPARPFTK